MISSDSWTEKLTRDIADECFRVTMKNVLSGWQSDTQDGTGEFRIKIYVEYLSSWAWQWLVDELAYLKRAPFHFNWILHLPNPA